MVMIKSLRKVGNSNALILERAVMELVGLDENAEVQIVVRNGSLIVTPADPRPVDRESLKKHLDRIVRKRRGALARLAE